MQHIKKFAGEGLRTLVVAKKRLKDLRPGSQDMVQFVLCNEICSRDFSRRNSLTNRVA